MSAWDGAAGSDVPFNGEKHAVHSHVLYFDNSLTQTEKI